MIPACGTYAAYQRHRRNNTTICDPCRQARNTYQADYARTHPASTKASVARCKKRWRDTIDTAATKYGEPWDIAEDTCLMRDAPTQGVPAVAAKLGRTVIATESRLRVLRARQKRAVA